VITGKPFGAGDTAVEGKVTDSANGELLGAAVDRRVGGTGLSTEKLSSWAEVEHALDVLGEEFEIPLLHGEGGNRLRETIA
jgi:hypothetical protein